MYGCLRSAAARRPAQSAARWCQAQRRGAISASFWRLRRPVGTAVRAAHERLFFGVGKAARGRGRSLAQVRICRVQQGRFESRAYRVIYVVDEPGRQGLACQDPGGHPESGGEAFIIGQRDDGTVIFAFPHSPGRRQRRLGRRGAGWRCGLREARCGPGRGPGCPDPIAGPG
ncbi:MAG: DUF1990 family protein [Streptosporangiaceae bacterium]